MYQIQPRLDLVAAEGSQPCQHPLRWQSLRLFTHQDRVKEGLNREISSYSKTEIFLSKGHSSLTPEPRGVTLLLLFATQLHSARVLRVFHCTERSQKPSTGARRTCRTNSDCFRAMWNCPDAHERLLVRAMTDHVLATRFSLSVLVRVEQLYILVKGHRKEAFTHCVHAFIILHLTVLISGKKVLA